MGDRYLFKDVFDGFNCHFRFSQERFKEMNILIINLTVFSLAVSLCLIKIENIR